MAGLLRIDGGEGDADGSKACGDGGLDSWAAGTGQSSSYLLRSAFVSVSAAPAMWQGREVQRRRRWVLAVMPTPRLIVGLGSCNCREVMVPWFWFCEVMKVVTGDRGLGTGCFADLKWLIGDGL
ncbi:hypothetical protein M0R45_008977 [Rubus argutus]|uniref:Uncharacterized protein n=1 Tax=Rubus argutus TaxID=59490 RepID=A0AAW1Y6M2_RUBAR